MASTVTELMMRRMMGANSGSSINWEAIARGMIDGTTKFSIDESVAAAFEGLTKLRARLFRGLTNLEGVVHLPSSITEVQTEAFYYCTNVTRVILGENVTSITNNAFQSLGGNFKALVIYATTPPTLSGANALSGSPQCIVYVPDAAVDDYKSANYWSSYATRIKGISELPTI